MELKKLEEMILAKEAEEKRKSELKKADNIFLHALKREMNRKKEKIVKETEQKEFYELKIQVQPSNPKPLTTTHQIFSLVSEIRVDYFPELRFETVPEGILSLQMNKFDTFETQQLYTSGLIVNSYKAITNKIYIAHLAKEILITLLLAKNYYQKIGYNGDLIGKVILKNSTGIETVPITQKGAYVFPGDGKKTLLPKYDWKIDVTTDILNDKGKLRLYFNKLVKDMHSYLGYEYELDDKIIVSFLEENKLPV